MMMQLDRSTRRLSPSVRVALSRMPSSSCHSESEAFSISSKSRIESLSFSVCHWLSASWVSRGWVSRWPRYPGGEPISLAISCECWNSAQSILMQARGVAEERLGHGLHDARLARTGRPEKQQIAHRAAGRRSGPPETSGKFRRLFRRRDPGRRSCAEWRCRNPARR